jgi:chromosomal replication initiator protein
MTDDKVINEFNWDSFLSLLKNSVDELSFDSWIKPLSFIKAEGSILYIAVPSKFIKNWVEMNFLEDIKKVLTQNWEHLKHIDIIVSSFHDLNSTKSDVFVSTDSIEGADLKTQDSQAFNDLEVRLNPEYTFDKFVVGNSNEFAYNAALKVAMDKQIFFNPLFVYGGVGLGKTHLMHSIAWSLKSGEHKRSFLYLTAEKFMNLYIVALRDRNIISFKEMFRSTDVLMIDDFQFISGKDGTQEEFFHTFNTLISQGKQIVLSADKSPSDLDKIEDRIISRLQAGLAVNISSTTYELRMGILESKIKQLNVKVPKEVLDFLAHTITSNVRELEGSLKRIITYHQLMGVKIDLNMAMNVLEDIIRNSNKTISIDMIQKKVAEHYDIKMADLSSTKKDKSTSYIRHIAMYISKQLTKHSLPEIGKKFGGRDHTTVMYSVRKIEDAIKTDANLESEIKLLINIIQKI